MKYFLIIIGILPSIYLISFAKFNWKNNNKTAAIGAILLAAVAIILQILFLFMS